MTQRITLRGTITAIGSDPADRIVVTATVLVGDTALAALAASSSEYTANCTLTAVAYTRASTGAVTSLSGSLASVSVYFRGVALNAPDKGRISSCLIPDLVGGLFSGTAFVTLFDEIVDTVDAPPPVTPSVTPDGLLGNYYAGGDIIGYPQTTRIDPVIDFTPFDTGNVPIGWAPPGLPWAIRWTGEIEAPVAGGYQFRVTADDGSRLTLDGVTLLNDWGANHGAIAAITTTQTYTAGQRIGVWLDLRNEGGLGVIRFEWKYPGQDWQLVPMAQMYSGEGVAPPALPIPSTPPERMRAYITTINRYPEA